MDEQKRAEKVARARQLLEEIHHVALSTVNSDGTPLSSPVFMAFNDQLWGYWSSSPTALHSQNIARNGRLFFAIFDSREGHGGLFIEASAEMLEDQKEIAIAYDCLSRLKERFYGHMGTMETYQGDGPQRLYCATPVQAWVNISERDASGVIIRDTRYLIPLADLC